MTKTIRRKKKKLGTHHHEDKGDEVALRDHGKASNEQGASHNPVDIMRPENDSWGRVRGLCVKFGAAGWTVVQGGGGGVVMLGVKIAMVRDVCQHVWCEEC